MQTATNATQAALFEVPAELATKPKRGAFGYLPEGWPTLKMFGAPVSPAQVKLVGQKARERGIPAEELPFVRELVLNAYGVQPANSKGNAALFIDWLMRASSDSIEEAVSAAMTYGEPVQLSLR